MDLIMIVITTMLSFGVVVVLVLDVGGVMNLAHLDIKKMKTRHNGKKCGGKEKLIIKVI